MTKFLDGIKNQEMVSEFSYEAWRKLADKFVIYNDKITVYYSDDIIDEYKRVLSRKEFSLNKSFIGNFINEFKKKAKHINPKKIEEELIDNTDIPFYALVLDKRVYGGKLITGNIKHYPKKNYIMTASDFINKVYKNK